MTRHIRWPVLLAVLGGALVIAFLVRFASTYSTVVVPASGGTYTEAMAGTPECVNPLFCEFNSVDRDLSALVFRGLARVSPRMNVVPDIASEWRISPDGLTYTFTLTPEARWHDGAPVTADDVVYTISTIQDPAFSGPPYLAELWREVVVSRVDARTVSFTLAQPFAPFLDYTTIGLLPAHLLAKVPCAELPRHAFNTAPVGNGPFILDSLDSERAVLRPDPDSPQKGRFDKLTIRFYPDTATALGAYERGEVDGISEVLPRDLSRAAAIKSLQLYTATEPEVTWVILNMSDATISTQGVRLALAEAVDRQKLIDSALGGQGVPVYGPLLPESWAYSSIVERQTYDPTQSRETLKATGWKPQADGTRVKDGVRLEVTLTYANDPEMQALASEIARQWQAVGVRVRLDPVSLSVLASERLRPRTFQAALYRWIDVPPDPDPYPFFHSTRVIAEGQNFSCMSIRAADELLEEARVSSDQDHRRELYVRFQQIFAEQVPGIFVYRPVYTMAVSDKVRGVQIGPLVSPSDRFASFHQWYVTERRVIVADAIATAVQPRR